MHYYINTFTPENINTSNTFLRSAESSQGTSLITKGDCSLHLAKKFVILKRSWKKSAKHLEVHLLVRLPRVAAVCSRIMIQIYRLCIYLFKTYLGHFGDPCNFQGEQAHSGGESVDTQAVDILCSEHLDYVLCFELPDALRKRVSRKPSETT